jgi:RecB family endonuclease NucS
MGISKGDKENYLNLYITLLNKETVEDIISEKVESLKWEYYFEAKKIDIYGKSDSGKTLFIENQITQADARHLNSIREIIKKAPNDSVVVWGGNRILYQYDDGSLKHSSYVER